VCSKLVEAPQVSRADLDAALRLLESWLPTSRRPTFVITSEVQDFVKRQRLEDEFTQVKNHLSKAFNNPEKVTVELDVSPDDEGDGGERLVFRVKSGMERRSFRLSMEAFFGPLRSGSMRIYPLIVVLRDL
jgi:hypothetical protein